MLPLPDRQGVSETVRVRNLGLPPSPPPSPEAQIVLSQLAILLLCNLAYAAADMVHFLGGGRLAFNYLEELQREFMNKFRDEIGSASRPYAFIKFGAALRMRL